MGRPLRGRKGSGAQPRSATRYDDNLFGRDTVEVLLALSEGPIAGLKDGAASFYVGDVPLLDKGTNTPNISNFELRLLKGTNPADSIQPKLGGLASSKTVNLPLRTYGQAIVVQGDKTQIDYIDIRLIINRLLVVSTTGGEFPNGLSLGIEVKPRSSSTWTIPFTNEPPPADSATAGASNYRPGATQPGTLVNNAYHETHLAPRGAPPASAQQVGAMWFITDLDPWSPRIWDGQAWQIPNGLGLTTIAGFKVWTWTDYDGLPRRGWMSPDGSTPPADAVTLNDFLVTPQSGEEVYSFNETAWVGTQAFGQAQTAAPGIVRINGLTRSNYPKEYRIPVARINEPYDVRVTRYDYPTTKDNFKDLTFESIQEVTRDVYTFQDLAVAWLTIKATDTFTAIPEFTGIYRGVLVPVPSNHVFNETTNLSEFPGIWDGTFKIAYTNNPAWHAYNFIKNARYGKNSYFPEVPDQWDFYEFGKHCSAHGFRFNEYIQEARSINELVNYIVGIAGGRYVDRGDGYSTVIWDADDQVAQAIFAPENTIEGSFTYSFTDVAERKNDFKVSFKNPDLNYREDRVRVWEQNTIDVIGRNAEEFVAVGCRSADEAIKRGRLRLATALSEKTIVTFKTNRLGRYLLPFQVILVADDQSTPVITGRIRNSEPVQPGATVLPLRDPIYLEAGYSFSASFTVSDGDGGLQVVTYPLTVAQPGVQERLVLGKPLVDALPEYAVFSIGAPKAFRITAITPVDGEPDQIEITAIEVNRLKWAFVDGKVQLRDLVPIQTGVLSKFVYPVTGAKITPEITTDGRLALLASWNPSETKLIRGYRIYQSINRQPMSIIGEPTEGFWRIANPVLGVYYVTIVAVSLDGSTESPPVTVQYTITDGTTLRSVPGPTNLRLLDEPEAPIFRAVNPRFAWDPTSDPLVDHYVVEVVNTRNAVVHRETVPGNAQLLFTYPLTQNRADNGGQAIRQFTVRVTAVDGAGNSSPAASLVVSHPPPAVITPEIEAVSEVIFVSYAPPSGDFQGVLVWMETDQGYDPLARTPRYDGSNTFIPLPAVPETTYFLHIAGYDSYGKTGLNIGPEWIKKATILLFDPMPPDVPDRPVLTTSAEVQPDGSVTATVRATWTLDTSRRLGRYEVAFAQSEADTPEYAKGYIFEGADRATWERRGFTPGKLVSVKVRAGNKDGYVSGYSQVATIVAAANMTPPLAVTALTASGGYDTGFLSWTASTSLDVDFVEVWGIDGTVTGATPAAGAVLLGKVSSRSTSYQDPALKGALKRTYWARPVNTSGITGTYTGPVSAASAAIVATEIRDGIVKASSFAAGIAVPVVVDTLPTNKTAAFVTLSTDGKLYRWDATAGKYTSQMDAGAVNAADIQGVLTDAQVASLSAAKLTGQITGLQIEDGAIVGAKLAVGAVTTASLAASAITAEKIATGAITADQIGANAITAAKIAAGAIGADQIAAGAITTDKLGANVVSADKIAANSIQSYHIVAGTITAEDISSGAITTDKLAARSITAEKLAVGALTADSISVGTGTLTSLLNGSNTTKINGGAIKANTITANMLKIGARQVQLVGINFQAERDANGAITGYLTWTEGYILIEGDSGNPESYYIPTSRVGIGTGYWYIWWNKSDPRNFAWGKDSWDVVYRDTDCILIATVSAITGISVLVGGTIIDGTRITARSIQADQISANAIQAYHIAAGQITADKIAAGAISAGSIGAGTITAGQINVGSDRFQLIGSQRRIRVFSNEGYETVSLGDVSPWVTGAENQQAFGIVIRGYGNVEILKCSNGGTWINGAAIGAATIGSAAIQDAVITNAKIQNLTVGNEKISDGAITYSLAKTWSGDGGGFGFPVRSNNSRILVLGVMRNNPNVSRSNRTPNSLILYWDPYNNPGNRRAIESLPKNMFYIPNQAYYWGSTMTMAIVENPGAGYHAFHIATDGPGNDSATLWVVELSK